MFKRRYQRLELILEDPKIDRRCRVIKMDNLEEQLFVVCTMSNVNFERMFLVMEYYLAYLATLLATRENMNVN